MISADQARKLSGPSVEERVERISVAIENAAKNGKTCLRTGWDYEEDEALWRTGGYNTSDEWKKAKTLLEENGFKVSFYYEEGPWIVNMYTLIEW